MNSNARLTYREFLRSPVTKVVENNFLEKTTHSEHLELFRYT